MRQRDADSDATRPENNTFGTTYVNITARTGAGSTLWVDPGISKKGGGGGGGGGGSIKNTQFREAIYCMVSV